MPRTFESCQIQWDDDYGIDHRSGWTISINGSILVQLVPFGEAIKALREWLQGKDA